MANDILLLIMTMWFPLFCIKIREFSILRIQYTWIKQKVFYWTVNLTSKWTIFISNVQRNREKQMKPRFGDGKILNLLWSMLFLLMLTLKLDPKLIHSIANALSFRWILITLNVTLLSSQYHIFINKWMHLLNHNKCKRNTVVFRNCISIKHIA